LVLGMLTLEPTRMQIQLKEPRALLTE